jgi:hypothetical protein
MIFDAYLIPSGTNQFQVCWLLVWLDLVNFGVGKYCLVLLGIVRYHMVLPGIPPTEEKTKMVQIVFFINFFYLVSCNIT